MRRWGGWLLLAALVAGAVPSWAANGDQKYKSNAMAQYQMIDLAVANTSGQWVDIAGYAYAMVECSLTSPGQSTFTFMGSNATTIPANATDGYTIGSMSNIVDTSSRWSVCGPTGGQAGPSVTGTVAGTDVCPRFVKVKLTGYVAAAVSSCSMVVKRQGNI